MFVGYAPDGTPIFDTLADVPTFYISEGNRFGLRESTLPFRAQPSAGYPIQEGSPFEWVAIATMIITVIKFIVIAVIIYFVYEALRVIFAPKFGHDVPYTDPATGKVGTCWESSDGRLFCPVCDDKGCRMAPVGGPSQDPLTNPYIGGIYAVAIAAAVIGGVYVAARYVAPGLARRKEPPRERPRIYAPQRGAA